MQINLKFFYDIYPSLVLEKDKMRSLITCRSYLTVKDYVMFQQYEKMLWEEIRISRICYVYY